MSQELVAVFDAGLLETQDRAAFAESAKSVDYLPRIQLMQGTSDLVKDEKIGVGRWALIFNKEEFVDLGNEFEALVLAFRTKAVRTTKPIVTSFNTKSPVYQDIIADSTRPNSGCMHGPEFLMWIPSQEKYATFHCSNPTARNAASQFLPEVGKALSVMVGSTKIDNGKNKWKGPSAKPLEVQIPLPTEGLGDQLTRFLKVPKDNVQLAEEGTERAR